MENSAARKARKFAMLYKNAEKSIPICLVRSGENVATSAWICMHGIISRVALKESERISKSEQNSERKIGTRDYVGIVGEKKKTISGSILLVM